MSSSPDGDSVGTRTPSSDAAPTSNNTATSGFTAVNGRHSPTGSDANLSGVNGGSRMDTSTASAGDASPYEMISSRVGGASPERASPAAADTIRVAHHSSPGKRKRADDERRDPNTEPGTYSAAASSTVSAAVNADKRHTPTPAWSDSPAQGMSRGANHQPADPKDGQAWYGPHRQHQRAESPNADARLVEALQRDNNQNVDARHAHHQDDEATMDHIGGTPQHQITSTTETTAAGVQVDPKKRKRIFSNRTKTGCQTCRKRKKKCDEGKPECTNCTRGGFVCEGYANKTPWQKPLHGKSTPIALQSKETYGDTGGLLPRPPREGYQVGGQPQLHPDGQRTRPILVDEDHPRSAWGNGWGDTQTPTRDYLAQRTSSIGFQSGAPLPDPTRQQASYESRAQDHHLSLTAHGQLLQQQHVENLPNEMGKRNDELSSLPHLRNHGGPSAMASTAQLALQHSHHMTTSSPAPSGSIISGSSLPTALRNGRPMTEKDKMTAQLPYASSAEQLVLEREACSGATWRFNNSQNPSTGVSREERSRLFRQILEPQTGDIRRSANPMHTGHLGQGVVVEAPFNCSYGYNTKIGDSTSIGRNCTIHDPVLVSIGARCQIGPNVDIYASEAVDEPGLETGVNGLEVGKQVEIEDGVIIEGRCVIKAGVRIRVGSRILAGTVVDKNVPAHVIFGPTNGCEVIAGKWQPGR